jgi:hypothetical protein
MYRRGATVRRTVDLDVPAHVAYERMCRIEEYPTFRAGVRKVTALSETIHRWELTGTVFTARLDERSPDTLLRWHSVEGPSCAERVVVEVLAPRRCRVVVESSGPPDLLADLTVDLAWFRRQVERDHPFLGHHLNERLTSGFLHRSNWRDGLLHGPPGAGTGAGADRGASTGADNDERRPRPK